MEILRALDQSEIFLVDRSLQLDVVNLETEDMETFVDSYSFMAFQMFAGTITGISLPSIHIWIETFDCELARIVQILPVVNRLPLTEYIVSKLHPMLVSQLTLILKNAFIEMELDQELLLALTSISTCSHFRLLAAIEADYIDMITKMLNTRISCGGYLSEHHEYLNNVIYPLLAIFETRSRDSWRHRLEFHVYRTCCNHLTASIFNLIVDYPDSMPQLNDLRQCLAASAEVDELLFTLEASVKKRLLHIGASTRDILTQYLSTAKCLAYLLPSNDSNFSVLKKMAAYLQSRSDNVASILDQIIVFDDSDDPHALAKADSDLLLAIVSDHSVFGKEYQVSLSRFLCENLTFDVDRKAYELEVLKTLFGEVNMNAAQVMLKDVADSRRISLLFHQKHIDSVPLNLT